MNATDFAFDPALYGLPTRAQLRDLRIWDLHYHGFNNATDLAPHERMMIYADRFGIERVVALDVGGSRNDPLASSPFEAVQRQVLDEQSDRVSGMIRIEPTNPEGSCRKMEEWIRRGPCVGIKYAGYNEAGITCSHPNNDPIIRLARELGAIVYIHTWMKVGGQPRLPGGGNLAGESTPADVVELAARFPDVPLICGHSGGDGELGARAVRKRKNVYFEFSGSYPHSGAVDHAGRELGAERIVWGGHGPTRSYATELSKVLDADLTDAQRRLIFGGNARRLAEKIFARKGYPMSPKR